MCVLCMCVFELYLTLALAVCVCALFLLYTQLIRGCKRLRLWLLSHGRVPTTRLAHKVYRWVDPEGRETTPPPDPFTIAEQRARGDYTFGSEVDERKVYTYSHHCSSSIHSTPF